MAQQPNISTRLYVSQSFILTNNMPPTHQGPGQHAAQNPDANPW